MKLTKLFLAALLSFGFVGTTWADNHEGEAEMEMDHAEEHMSEEGAEHSAAGKATAEQNKQMAAQKKEMAKAKKMDHKKDMKRKHEKKGKG